MKRLTVGLLSAVLIMSLLGCRTVIVTSADELMSHSWHADTLSGISGDLIFHGDSATFKVTSASGDEAVIISGSIAIDSKNFYITSTELFTTYTFGYTVYHDRAEITYGGENLIFYPVYPTLEADGK